MVILMVEQTVYPFSEASFLPQRQCPSMSLHAFEKLSYELGSELNLLLEQNYISVLERLLKQLSQKREVHQNYQSIPEL
ncbi:unnamed protein product [Brassica oleracea var. botrytis]|uniref:Uncharacterized protein n=3 Tax=Brassica TaxID=3705 RepID=A0A0D3A8G5_BRAOL|nr:unnamed protein product [Brassica napus]CDY26525.1 BnaC01g23740D [Brassica napus]VDD50504.1 unnamed protein product [Brassica oleracea]